jgi:signal transduction histidine kinase
VLHLQGQSFEGKLIFNLEEHITLYFDKGYLNRTLTNLVKNAIQAIPEDREGIIEVAVTVNDKNQLHLKVIDNGTGIPKAQQEKIFLPYFSTKVIGMGLGLPIVKSMIESGGGEIWFETEENIGTTFHILLPLTREE